MAIHRCDPVRHDTLAVTLLQLRFQDVVAAIHLLDVSVQCVVVLGRMVVAEPGDLACHRAEGGEEEELPCLEVDDVLFRGGA